jgi:uncharacterized RDD family membrane protein YckC
MLIIFGRKTVETPVARGEFVCPNCRDKRTYILKKHERFFSLFFIPIFPTGSLGEAVECTSCGLKYVPNSVLSPDEYQPLTETSETEHLIYAPAGKRIAAYLIDMLFLILLNFPLAILIGKLPEHISSFFDGRFQLAFIPLWIIYFFLFEYFTGGYTIGKKLFSVKTSEASKNNYISFPAAFIRALIKVIPVIHIVFLFTKNNRAIHDFAAGSAVIQQV